MSALHALSAALSAGVRVRLDGDALDLSAEHEPPETVLELLHRHKAELLRLLRPSLDGWLAEDWQAFFDERAAIYEFEGGLARPEAEARAFACCVVEWLNRNGTQSPPGRCLNCGGGDRDSDPLLPFGTETSGHAWVHCSCWPAWQQMREEEAIAALSAMGLRREATTATDFCLKSAFREKRLSGELTKPTKLNFVSFDSAQSKPISEIETPLLDLDGVPCAGCPHCGKGEFWRWSKVQEDFDACGWRCWFCAPPPSESGPCDFCGVPDHMLQK
jgi:hypothetical protein